MQRSCFSGIFLAASALNCSDMQWQGEGRSQPPGEHSGMHSPTTTADCFHQLTAKLAQAVQNGDDQLHPIWLQRAHMPQQLIKAAADHAWSVILHSKMGISKQARFTI